MKVSICIIVYMGLRFWVFWVFVILGVICLGLRIDCCLMSWWMYLMCRVVYGVIVACVLLNYNGLLLLV